MATRIGVSEREAKRGKLRIIVDCTHTFHTGAGTGIQRLVRRYADELLAIGREDGIEVVPVRLSGPWLVPLPIVDGRVAFPRSDSARESVSSAQAPQPRSARMLHALAFHVQRLTRSRHIERWLGGGPNEDSYLRRATSMSPLPAPAGALTISRDDILLSLDSSWVYDIRSALEAAGQAGARRFAVLCDVLPLSQPQWFTEGTRRWFRGWLEVLLPRLEGVVTISETTRAELSQLVASGEIGVAKLPPSAAVHLGAELAHDPRGAVRPALEQALGPGTPPAFLAVGTLEPRKNVEFALDIFDALDARGLAFQWHIVGAPGWLAEHTAERIRAHAALGTRLHWWTDLTDAELAWTYRQAAALVAVSKAEGFGLPAVEARLNGMAVFASDIPVFREVLGDEASYLPLGSAALAAAILEDFLSSAPQRVSPAAPSRVARSWRGSARMLLDTILSMGPRRT